jgi:hypothetical protein
MRYVAKFASICLVMVLAAIAPAQADPVPSTGPALEKRLASYDPKAVTAARHYFLTPAIKTGMLAMIDNMNNAMLGLIAKQNAGLTPDQANRVKQVVGDALKERLDLLTQMNMVVALDTFSTDEIVALDKFYSSPEGVAILSKMPKMMQQLPAMMQTIMPDYLNEVKTKLKASDPELKL